jgi:hypothetical protein
MQAHRRQMRFALAFGIGGALLVVFGRGVNALDVGPSPLILAAWGLLTGSVIGWFVASLPQRATFPLGFGTLAAAMGAVGLLVFLANVLHQDLLDAYGNELFRATLVCAGIGWVFGAAIGAALAAHAPRLTAAQAWLLRAAAIAAVPIGLVVAWLQGLSTGVSRRPEPYLVPLQRALIADAVLVCVTLLLVAGGRHPTEAGDGKTTTAGSWFTRGTAWTGVAIGSAVLVALLGSVLVTPRALEVVGRLLVPRRQFERARERAHRTLLSSGVVKTSTPMREGVKPQPGRSGCPTCPCRTRKNGASRPPTSTGRPSRPNRCRCRR